MCPISAAHSLFIRLLTSETNLEKKKQNKTKLFMALWVGGALADVIQGDVLHADLFPVLLTFSSLEALQEERKVEQKWMEDEFASRRSGRSGQTLFVQVQSREHVVFHCPASNYRW